MFPMKKHFLLLAAACCLALPAGMRADDYGTLSKKNSIPLAKAAKAAAVINAKKRPQQICYITNQPRTGSLIPMVYRQYNKGRLDAASNAAVYGQESLRFTGSDDVAGALVLFDPSISLRGH